MSSGWVKLHRKFIDWEWYGDINTKVLFIHCLLKANHTDKRWMGNLIKRGTFITSLSHLSLETGLSVRQVRTSLDKLKSTGEIDKVATSVNTCISITNYDDYQSSDKPMTSERQSSDKRATTTKNDKNDKNDKNIPTLDEVQDYFKEKGFGVDLANRFYQYYNEPMKDNDGRVWKDQSGKTVKSWKQKALAVWMKDDNKTQMKVIDGGKW